MSQTYTCTNRHGYVAPTGSIEPTEVDAKCPTCHPERLAKRGDASLVADALREFASDAPPEYAEAMERVASRLDPNFTQARRALGRDEFLDTEGPTVHLHPDVADALLVARGWTIRRWGTDEPLRRGLDADHAAEITGKPHSFISPDGHRYWHRSEAITLALTAEGLANA